MHDLYSYLSFALISQLDSFVLNVGVAKTAQTHRRRAGPHSPVTSLTDAKSQSRFRRQDDKGQGEWRPELSDTAATSLSTFVLSVIEVSKDRGYGDRAGSSQRAETKGKSGGIAAHELREKLE